MAALVAAQSLYFLKRGAVLESSNQTYTDLVAKAGGHTEAIARSLFTDFLLPFEITSILLLVAIVGAVVLAKREV